MYIVDTFVFMPNKIVSYLMKQLFYNRDWTQVLQSMTHKRHSILLKIKSTPGNWVMHTIKSHY